MKRIAVITGVASGIGKATAEIFSSNGWYVVGIDCENVHDQHSIDLFFHANVASENEWEKISNELRKKKIQEIDALINNAAVQICKPLLATLPEDWNLILLSNVYSVYLAVKTLFPLIREGGAIVNVSSVHALMTSKNLALYAASKGALLSLTRAMALEFADEQIRVNAVLPGSIDTPMLRASLLEGAVSGREQIQDLLHSCGKRQVMGRVGQPREVGRAILFLADTGESAYITGQTLIVDGGATARLSTTEI